MKTLLIVGLVGCGIVITISFLLWSGGGHIVSLPFIIPFGVMLLISLTSRKKRS